VKKALAWLLLLALALPPLLWAQTQPMYVTYFVQGGAGVADTYEVCMKDAADNYAWVALAIP
jgi:hypothetical protein